jgi:cardiolipin synthase
VDTVPRWVNAANLLTLLRLGLVPFAVSAILAGQHGRALSLVLIAGLTDTIDGTLARHFGMATTVGAYFDPIVDKFFLCAVYISLAMVSKVPSWLVMEILARDVLILVACGGAIVFGGARRFPPSVWGKASTFLQILCALSIMIGNANPAWPASLALVWPVAILTAFSGIHYLVRGVRGIESKAAMSP